MRTVFVNPSRKRRSKKTRTKRRNVSLVVPNPKRRSRKISRRRNAGINSFIQRNPLILENPRRRSRRHGIRRRNPGFVNPTFNIKGITRSLMSYGGGSALGFAVDQFVIKKLPITGEHAIYIRTAARLGAAMLAARYAKGELGAAAAGAVMYPAIQELYEKFAGASASGDDYEADLMADLSDMEDLIDTDDDMQVDGF